MLSMIEHSRPCFGSREEAVLLDSVRAGWTGEGPAAQRLVERLCLSTGQAGGITVGSATDGLCLALMALNPSSASRILMPSYVCRDVLDAVLRAGYRPRLCDVKRQDFNIDLSLDLSGERIGAAIVPHMFGFPVNVMSLVQRRIPVIEDCAHGAGSSILGKPVGSMGAYSVFSLSAIKSLPAGEGGVVLSKDPQGAQRLSELKYGTEDVLAFRCRSRTSDLTAALALVQLDRLQETMEARTRLAERFMESLSHCEIEFLEVADHADSAIPGWHRFIVKSRAPFKVPLSQIIERFWKKGVRARLPVTPGSLHRYLGLNGAPCPIAEDLEARSLSLPFYPNLKEEEVRTVLDVGREILEEEARI